MAFSLPVWVVFLQADSERYLATAVLFGVNVLWTLLYDTQYAMADYQDDLSLSIHSSVKWLASQVLPFIQTLMAALLMIGWCLAWWAAWPFVLALLLTHALFYWQIKCLQQQPWPRSGMETFLSHVHLGGLWCLALWLSYQ